MIQAMTQLFYNPVSCQCCCFVSKVMAARYSPETSNLIYLNIVCYCPTS